MSVITAPTRTPSDAKNRLPAARNPPRCLYARRRGSPSAPPGNDRRPRDADTGSPCWVSNLSARPRHWPGRTPGPGQSPCRTSATRHMARHVVRLTGALIYHHACAALGVFQRPIHRRTGHPEFPRQGCFRVSRQCAPLNLRYLLRTKSRFAEFERDVIRERVLR